MRAVATSRSTDTRSHILDTAQRLVAAQGFSSVGLAEILSAAGVPKGSFYHWFASKEAFGVDLLEAYFGRYLAEVDQLLFDPSKTARNRLSAYWAFWRSNQEQEDPDAKCLAVKLGAEVSDMSEGMRMALKNGTSAVIDRLTEVIRDGVADGSITSDRDAGDLAQALYQLWMGASVMYKIERSKGPFALATVTAEQMLSKK